MLNYSFCLLYLFTFQFNFHELILFIFVLLLFIVYVGSSVSEERIRFSLYSCRRAVSSLISRRCTRFMLFFTGPARFCPTTHIALAAAHVLLLVLISFGWKKTEGLEPQYLQITFVSSSIYFLRMMNAFIRDARKLPWCSCYWTVGYQ